MSRNINIMTNEVKMKLESVANNLKKIEMYVNDILIEIKHRNVPPNRKIISDRLLSVLTLVVAVISLLVACYATYTSNKLSINNSALNFTYKNIGLESIYGEKFILNVGNDIGTQGAIKINIETSVISGQIKSLYLVRKQNEEFRFILLNNEGIQDKFSGIGKYTVNTFIDIEKKIEYENKDIGIANMYILSEDINGQIEVDTIQIVGSIVMEYDDENHCYNVNFNNVDYSFRYLKNNKLITLHGKDDVKDGWVNLSDKDLDIIEEIDIKKIEEDIAMIKEKYAKY